MIALNRIGDVLKKNRLTRARRRDDQTALALADGRHQVDDAGGAILDGRIFNFHLQPLIRVERRQVVEMNLVTRLFRIFEIDRVNLGEGEIALPFFRLPDQALDRIAGAKRESADLVRRDIDVVRPRQIVRVR